MASHTASEMKLEIGHVLFIDIVGYSQLLITQQSEQIEALRRIVRGTAQFQEAEAEGKLLRLPTGDGSALVFRTTPDAPVLCAMEIAKDLKKHPELKVRMGIHSGPVNAITDLNEQANIAGAGINIAQRVMDCGDAGHILLSKHVAEDLEHYPRWRPYLHDLGECEVKHGVRVSLVNLYTDDAGNAALPARLAAQKRSAASGKRFKGFWTFLIAAGILVALGVPALIFTPAIVKSLRFATNRDKALPSAVPEKSIAVLPFQNLSDDKQNAFFADGVQDEVLTNLAKVADDLCLLRAVHTDNEAHARAVLEDPKARQYVGVLGLQWGGLPIAQAARKLVPGLRVWQTETDCGNHHWEPGFDPAAPQNDFAYAADTWRHMRDYFAGGAEVYTVWNIVLDETGKSIDAKQPWPQNSPVVIDRKAKTVTYTPMFKAFAHWSIFARPGAVVLRGSGSENALAFADVAPRVVVELMNPTAAEKSVRVKVEGRAWDAILPARSFGTLIINME